MPVILDHPEAGLARPRGFAIDKPRREGLGSPLIRGSPGTDPMHAAVLTIHLLLALALILVVLLQRSEGGGLGIGGGGGIMTSRGAATALSKVTWVIGIAFVVTSLTLTVMAARDAGTGSVVDTVLPPRPTAPTAPAAPPAPGLGGDLLPQLPAETAPAAPGDRRPPRRRPPTDRRRRRRCSERAATSGCRARGYPRHLVGDALPSPRRSRID